jgi:hypothetical protein
LIKLEAKKEIFIPVWLSLIKWRCCFGTLTSDIFLLLRIVLLISLELESNIVKPKTRIRFFMSPSKFSLDDSLSLNLELDLIPSSEYSIWQDVSRNSYERMLLDIDSVRSPTLLKKTVGLNDVVSSVTKSFCWTRIIHLYCNLAFGEVIMMRWFEWDDSNEMIRMRWFGWDDSDEMIRMRWFGWDDSDEMIRMRWFEWDDSDEMIRMRW